MLRQQLSAVCLMLLLPFSRPEDTYDATDAEYDLNDPDADHFSRAIEMDDMGLVSHVIRFSALRMRKLRLVIAQYAYLTRCRTPRSMTLSRASALPPNLGLISRKCGQTL